MSANALAPGPRYEALIQLIRTAETLWNTSRVFFAQWAISPSQFNILNLLLDLPEGRTQVELSRELLMHRSNVTGLIDRLEARHLVERRDAPGDRRAYRVVLTPAGRALVFEVLPFYYQAAERVWGRIAIARARAVVNDLSYVSHNAEQMAAEFTAKPERPHEA